MSARDTAFFLDPSRCIGCRACVHACAECDTHRGHAMIHVDFINREQSPQTVPVVCMHCDPPACAMVCPADAIKQTDDGIVHSAMRSRCIGCSNCVLACPFGVPKYETGIDQMMKCDMCHDRTAMGKRPLCVSVCPSGALYYGPRSVIEHDRPERAANQFRIGNQILQTGVNMMMPSGLEEAAMDITRWMEAS